MRSAWPLAMLTGVVPVGRWKAAAVRGLVALALVTGSTFAGSARAEWRRTSDIELNTAYTLEESTISVGLLSPMTVGVTESLQASIHPLLLLMGQPSLGLRLRLTPIDDVTVAMNLNGAWSLIRSETRDGIAAAQADPGEPVGRPGTLQLGSTVTIAFGKHWLGSLGGGVGADFLGTDPFRGLVELHASLHWLPAPRHLVMLQSNGYLDLRDGGALLRPAAQLVYGWAASSRVHLAAGVGLGDWVWEDSDGSRRSVRVFPLFDVIFRL